MVKFFVLFFFFFNLAHSDQPNFEYNLVAIPLNRNLLLNIPIFTNRDLEQIKVIQLGGCSNINYLLDDKYVLRIPGKASHVFINRVDEFANINEVSEFSFVPKLEYFDVASGLQLTSYVNNARSINVECLDTLEKIAMLLKKIHTSGCKFQGKNCFSRIRDCLVFLKTVCPHKLEDYEFFMEVYSNLSSVLQADSLINFPTHADTTPENFLLTSGEIVLIDWEYSAFNDPAWDFAYFSIESGINRRALDLMLSTWTDSKEGFNHIKNRVFMYEPIVEFWICLWADIQLATGSSTISEEALEQLKKIRLSHCKELIRKQNFQELYNSIFKGSIWKKIN